MNVRSCILAPETRPSAYGQNTPWPLCTDGRHQELPSVIPKVTIRSAFAGDPIQNFGIERQQVGHSMPAASAAIRSPCRRLTSVRYITHVAKLSLPGGIRNFSQTMRFS